MSAALEKGVPFNLSRVAFEESISFVFRVFGVTFDIFLFLGILRTDGLDTEVVLDPGDEINILKKVDLDDVKEAIGNFQIQGVPFFIEASRDYNLIEQSTLTIMNPCGL